ncbi:hypothetical protein [uncultured Draconibacterium sp.]|uniref:hypothetical protein n=1 Tax=uncultured Draconibacterium sp. TaxID=1573823 RepID=UPI0029C8E644|nr:hypothetical protein [uncultured Draconibacterium sp.]
MNYRDLEAVRQIVNNATGLDISYAYEDLVFPEHGAFIIQFNEDSNEKLHCYFHEDCIAKDAANIFANLKNESEKRKCELQREGAYNFEQVGENIQIRFL